MENKTNQQKTYPGFAKKPWQASKKQHPFKSFANKGMNVRLLQMYSGKKGK